MILRFPLEVDVQFRNVETFSFGQKTLFFYYVSQPRLCISYISLLWINQYMLPTGMTNNRVSSLNSLLVLAEVFFLVLHGNRVRVKDE